MAKLRWSVEKRPASRISRYTFHAVVLGERLGSSPLPVTLVPFVSMRCGRERGSRNHVLMGRLSRRLGNLHDQHRLP